VADHTNHSQDGWATILKRNGGQQRPTLKNGPEFLVSTGYVLYLPNFYIFLICTLATSTDVERAFSWDGLTVSKMRHSLSDESTWAAAVLGSWCTFPGAVPHEEIMRVFKEKSKSDKGKEMVWEGAQDTGIEIVMTEEWTQSMGNMTK
jgi:hypothetical protein